MSIQEVLQWWNLIYAVPLVVSLVWIVATMLGGVHGGGHAGHGAGHDMGHGIGQAAHDVAQGVGHAAHEIGHAIGHAVHHGDSSHSGAAHGHAGHGDAGHGHDTHAHGAHHEEGFGDRLLSLLGIGRIPVTLLIGIFLLCWGAFGMATNQFFAGTLKHPALYIWPSMGVTFLISAFFTRFLAAAMGRVMPQTETYGVSRYELVGSLGRTVYATGENKGTVDIKDAYGTVHRVQAKTEAGREAIHSGAEVMVIDFDEGDNRFIVRISDL